MGFYAVALGPYGKEPTLPQRWKETMMIDRLKNALLYYRELRLHNLRSTKYKHLFLLLYWPLFGLIFLSLERIVPAVWQAISGSELVYQEVVSVMDAYIPFCEWFVLPYYFWFVFLVGMLLYGLLFDIQAFRDYMWFVILSYSVTAVIYCVYPNMQALRPVEFPRDNLLVDIVRNLYDFDTNTNVCPSIHVLGSLAVCFAGLKSERLRGVGWKLFFIISTVLISLSTVFLKQHSIIDVWAALLLGAICYPFVFCLLSREPKFPFRPREKNPK